MEPKCEQCINRVKKCSLCKYDSNNHLDFFELPVEKQSNKNTNYRFGTRVEKKIAKKMEGRVLPGSGAMSQHSVGLAGDVFLPNLNVLVQSKATRSKEKITIKLDDIEKHWKQATAAGAYPAFMFTFAHCPTNWVITECNEPKDLPIIIVKKRSFTLFRINLISSAIVLMVEGKHYLLQEAATFIEEMKNAQN